MYLVHFNFVHNSFWKSGSFSQYFLFVYQITPLHLAAKKGHAKVALFLLSKEADKNIQDNNGVSI